MLLCFPLEGSRAEEEAAPPPPSIFECAALRLESAQRASEGDFKGAIPLLERALEGDIAIFGAESPAAAITLARIADLYRVTGHPLKARGMARKALAIQRATMGDTPLLLAKTIIHVAKIEADLEDFEAAETAMREALALQSGVVGASGRNALETRYYLGSLLLDAGQALEASACLKLALGDCGDEPALAPLRQALVLRLAASVRRSGAPAEALALLDRFDGESKLHPETTDPEATVTALSIRAEIAIASYEREKARMLLEDYLRVSEENFGERSPLAADARNSLGLFLLSTGDAAGASRQLRAALSIASETKGVEHPDTARMLRNLAAICMALDQTGEQKTHTREALRIFLIVFGDTHPETLVAKADLAQACLNSGEMAQADALIRECMESRGSILAANDPMGAEFLGKLGALQRYLGQREAAAETYAESLHLLEKIRGPEHPDLPLALNNLATVLYETGRADEALTHLHRARTLCERVLAPDHPDLALILVNLSLIEMSERKLENARTHLRQALGIRRKSNGENHWHTGTTLGNLAILETLAGNDSEAAPLFEQSLAILLQSPRSQPLIVWKLLHRQAGNALRMEGPDSPTARRAGRTAITVYRENLERVLTFTTEQERLDWRSQGGPLGLAVSLALASETADLLLASKGIILDSVAEDRRAASRAGGNWEELVAVREKLRANQMGFLADASGTAGLLKRRNQLERAIARQTNAFGNSRQSLARTSADLAATLPTETAFVDYFRYQRDSGTDISEDHYAATLITREAPPLLVHLGAARPIDETVALHQHSARGFTDEETLGESCRSLHQAVVAPLLAVLPETITSLVLCPDAALHRISFAALLDANDRFLVETHSLRYVASGRDLLFQNANLAPARRGADAVIFSDIRYDVKSPDALTPLVASRSTLGSADVSSLEQLAFPALPETEREGTVLAADLRARGLTVRPFSAGDATETSLRSLGATRILHLATHGFVLSPPSDAESHPAPAEQLEASDAPLTGPRSPMASNPMLQCGLALAGATNTVALWKSASQESPAPAADGILLADEVADLDLAGVELVVLSACDTGAGEILSGEGVFGLRRGFLLAGAENLLLTLWPVNSGSTTDFMIAFYERLLAGSSAPDALTETQRDLLVRLRHEKGLVHAVNRAAPFVMTVRGCSLEESKAGDAP